MGMTIAEGYARWADLEAIGSSATYETWARNVAQDAEVATVLNSLAGTKRQPNLVFAAARWHGAEASYESFRDTVLGKWPAVRSTIMRRSTQTNEAARCAVLLPYIAEIDGPIALLEVGAAAGLCLIPDYYSYRYSDGTALDPDGGVSDVVIECAVTGDVPVPGRYPEIVWRAGLDLHPIDPADEDSARWLQTLVWPEHTERRRRLRRALTIARTHRPDLVEGDLVDDVEALAAQAPSDATLVIFHSAVLVYVEAERRKKFASIVRRQPGRWMSNEGQAVFDFSPLSGARTGDCVLAVDGRPRAFTHPHGAGLHGLTEHI